jgi:hypothetical protein
MRTRKVIALSLLSAGAAVLFSGCPNQPPGPCVVARAFASQIEGSNPGAEYVVKYYFTSEATTGSDCATARTADPGVATWPAGDFVGGLWAEAFGQVTAINKVTGLVPDEFGWTNPFTGDYVEGSPNSTPPVTDNPIITGAFTTDTEDANGTCTIAPTSPGVQLVPNAVDSVLVTYQYNTALLYVTAAAGEGTQMQAQVTITRQSQIAGVPACIQNYTAIGFWPTVVCNIDNDCNPLPQPDATPPRPIGSGLLPGVPFACDKTLVPEAPIFIPADDLGDFGCGDGTDAEPFILQTPGCGGGAKNNNGILVTANGAGQSGVCFFASPSPTKFPYTD